MMKLHIIVIFCAILSIPSSATENDKEVNVGTIELALLLDASPSMYVLSRHWEIQRDGHAWALTQPEVTQLLVQNDVVVRVIVWAGNWSARELFDPIHIRTDADVKRLAALIKSETPTQNIAQGTVHAEGVSFTLMQPRLGMRLIIDVVTDEKVEESDALFVARRMATLAGYQINVLTIGENEHVYETADTFLRTPNGFIRHIGSWEGFREAIKRKLVFELS